MYYVLVHVLAYYMYVRTLTYMYVIYVHECTDTDTYLFCEHFTLSFMIEQCSQLAWHYNLQILDNVAISAALSSNPKISRSDRSWFSFVEDTAIGLPSCVTQRRQTWYTLLPCA